MSNNVELTEKLIVDVDAYLNTSKVVSDFTQQIEELVSKYITLLSDAKEKGVKSGQTADALENFITEIKKVKNVISEAGNSYVKIINDFLHEIDVADELLYDNNGIKYFRDSDFDDLLAIVDKTPEPSRESFGSWLYNLFLKIFSSLLPEAKGVFEDEEAELVRRMKETKQLTGEEVVNLKMKLKNIDRISQQRLSDVYYAIERFYELLEQIYSVVSNDFSMGNHGTTTFLASINMLSTLAITVVNNDVCAENKKIKYFVDTVMDYFKDSTSIIKIICEESLGKIVTGDKEKYITTVRELNNFFNEKSKDYLNSKEKFNETKEKFDELLELYKKYGGDFSKHYTGDKQDIEIFNQLVDKVSEFSKKSDDYIDIWYQMFFDMEESREALLRFKGLYSNDELSNESVMKAIERVEKLYNKEVDAYIDTTLDLLYTKVKKDGIGLAVKELKEVIPKQYSIIGNMVGKITEQAYKEAPAVALYDTVEATQIAFNNAVEELRNSDPGAENYQQLVNNVKEQFNYAKEIRIEFFETIISSSEGQNKRYYELCLNDIKSASLKDISKLDMTGRGEYNGDFNYITYATDEMQNELFGNE